jgi:signal transduction histidine kinase
MRWPTDLVAFVRRYRAPLSLGLAVGLSMTLVMVVVLATLFALESHESAEEVQETLESDLQRAARRLLDGRVPELRGSGAAFRVLDGVSTRILVGPWPTGDKLDEDEASSLELALSPSHAALCDSERLRSGRILEACVPLEGFVEDRRRHLLRVGVGFGVSLLGVILVSVYAARRALAPLRGATRVIECVDERRLEARLPIRGTDDDVDRHARALNRVLERLEGSFDRMARFTADAAHELRTPVNRILNVADVALLRSDPQGRDEGLEAVRGAAEQMRRLIEDMLLLARGDEGRLDLRPEVVVSHEPLAGLAELYRPSCEERGISLVTVTGDVDAKCVTDRALLLRALSNLIDNAVRHTPRGGRIELSLTTEADSLTYGVSDSGPGVPRADRERIFDRFVRLEPASPDGTGLGLPIARMAARRLGGDLVLGDSPFGGARLTLRVPIGPPEGPPLR